MRLILWLGFVLVALAALSASAAAQEDPPPLPIPGPSIATGTGSTPLHRFEFKARGLGRAGTSAFGTANFFPLARRTFRWSIQVTCLRVAENRAVVGGAATRAGRPAGGVLFFVEDNVSGNDGSGSDRISRLQGFKAPPRECPDPIMPARAAQRVQGGDIFIKATRGG